MALTRSKAKTRKYASGASFMQPEQSNVSKATDLVSGVASLMPGVQGKVAAIGGAAADGIGSLWKDKQMGEGVSVQSTGEAAVTAGIKGATSGFAMGNTILPGVGGLVGGAVGAGLGSLSGLLASGKRKRQAQRMAGKLYNERVDSSVAQSAGSYGAAYAANANNYVPMGEKGMKVQAPVRTYAGGGSGPGRSYQAKNEADYKFRVQALQDSSDVHHAADSRNAQILQLNYSPRQIVTPRGMKAETSPTTTAAVLQTAARKGFFGPSQGGVQPAGENRYLVPDMRPAIHNPQVPSALFIPGIDPVQVQAMGKKTEGYYRSNNGRGLVPDAPDVVDSYHYQAPLETTILRPPAPVAQVTQPLPVSQAPPASTPAPLPQASTRPQPKAAPAAPKAAVLPQASTSPAAAGRFLPSDPMPQDSAVPRYGSDLHRRNAQAADPNAQKRVLTGDAYWNTLRPSKKVKTFRQGGDLAAGTIPIYRAGGAIITGGQRHSQGNKEYGKGNPIVSGSEKVAETEREELVLDISHTQELEKLVYSLGGKNDTATYLQIGRLMKAIIVEDTQDNSGKFDI